LFKNQLNILNYYFAKFGFTETLKFFGYSEEDMGLFTFDENIINENSDEYNLFLLGRGNTVFYAKKELMESSKFAIDFVLSIIEMLDKNIDHGKVDVINYWEKKLGTIYTKNVNVQTEKAQKILISFGRILDNSTKKTLRLADEDKVDTYSIVRWMVRNYDVLSKKDNMSLRNKRLRVYEYLLHPLLIKFSNSTYRLLNKNQVTYSQRKQMFSTLSPGYVVKKLKTNELIRYSNAVNGIDLFTSALKWSQRGPQSMLDGCKFINNRYRGLHPSYVGRIGLAAASASDPGTSGSMTPFIQTNGFYFTDNDDNED